MSATADHGLNHHAAATSAQSQAERSGPVRRGQQTIATTAVVEGFGYWSGDDVRVEFRPAAPDTGIVFVRGDLTPVVRVPAEVAYRIETPRRTTLTSGPGSVAMVEHIMAALSGLQIDNCEVWIDRSEMPGCDGSSQPFVAALDRAGIVPQAALRPLLMVTETTRLGDADHWIEARPSTDGQTRLRYRLDYSGRSAAIGRQTAEFVITPDTFRRELAACRTFMLEEEATWLLSQGFGTRVTTSDVLIFNDDGPIDNELRFENECVRHKVLDMVGDLALAGCDLLGHIIAHRTGHRLNAELLKVLIREGQQIDSRRMSA